MSGSFVAQYQIHQICDEHAKKPPEAELKSIENLQGSPLDESALSIMTYKHAGQHSHGTAARRQIEERMIRSAKTASPWATAAKAIPLDQSLQAGKSYSQEAAKAKAAQITYLYLEETPPLRDPHLQQLRIDQNEAIIAAMSRGLGGGTNVRTTGEMVDVHPVEATMNAGDLRDVGKLRGKTHLLERSFLLLLGLPHTEARGERSLSTPGGCDSGQRLTAAAKSIFGLHHLPVVSTQGALADEQGEAVMIGNSTTVDLSSPTSHPVYNDSTKDDLDRTFDRAICNNGLLLFHFTHARSFPQLLKEATMVWPSRNLLEATQAARRNRLMLVYRGQLVLSTYNFSQICGTRVLRGRTSSAAINASLASSFHCLDELLEESLRIDLTANDALDKLNIFYSKVVEAAEHQFVVNMTATIQQHIQSTDYACLAAASALEKAGITPDPQTINFLRRLRLGSQGMSVCDVASLVV